MHILGRDSVAGLAFQRLNRTAGDCQGSGSDKAHHRWVGLWVQLLPITLILASWSGVVLCDAFRPSFDSFLDDCLHTLNQQFLWSLRLCIYTRTTEVQRTLLFERFALQSLLGESVL